MQKLFRILLAVFFPIATNACIWDADSLAHEKSRSHDLAQTILGEQNATNDLAALQARLQDLEAHRKETDPDWWNNLAGAYLRLNQPEDAVKLLKPVIEKFPDNYGMHANLGTAYHLLGQYADAEKEIARDLEINPNAHFGLEKYHLALLQYLARDQKYQSRHVYVDEATVYFLGNSWTGDFRSDRMFDEDDLKSRAERYTNSAAAEQDYQSLIQTNGSSYEARRTLATVAVMDTPPAYRAKWDLIADANFEGGVIYMAQMNPKEPACYAMLGIAAWIKRDYHLAAVAFDKAVTLGSPQSNILKERAANLKQFIHESENRKTEMKITLTVGVIMLVLFVWGLCRLVRAGLRISK